MTSESESESESVEGQGNGETEKFRNSEFFLRLDSDANKAEYRLMQTLSPTKARSNLTFWLKAAGLSDSLCLRSVFCCCFGSVS